MIARKLRIMMVVPTPFFSDCGSHVRIYEEARALIRRGHLVRIVCYATGRTMPDVPVDRISAPAWLEKLAPEATWSRPYLDSLLLKQAIKTARSFRPHLIHAHHHQGARIGAQLKKRLKIPLLFDCHESLSEAMVESGAVRAGSLLHRFLCQQERRITAASYEAIITTSSALAKNLVSQWGVAESAVSPLLDGVNTALFRPQERAAVRAKLRLPPGMQLVVYLGALNQSQGIDTLLSAIVQLKSRGSSLRFLLMGGGEEVYRAKSRDLGIDEMINFTGAIEYSKAPFYLGAGDIAVSPKISPAESNSKLLTYLACGLPTVAFTAPANRELLGDAGVYADYADCNDLANKLTTLMASREERERLRALGLAIVDQRHSWDIRGAALDEIYRLKLKR